MKFNANLVVFAVTALGSFSGVLAGPAPLPMGVEILEQNGSLVVREVSPLARTGLEKRCRECVHVGGHCTIGDGSCYAREKASCTWCGNQCGSRCIPENSSCQEQCQG